MAAIMNDLCNVSELVGFESLVKGATYRVLYARKCMSPQGIRLFLKLRTPSQYFRRTAQLLCRHSSNVANRQKQPTSTFSQLFLLGRRPNGDPINLLRKKDIRMPTYAQMRAIGLIGN